MAFFGVTQQGYQDTIREHVHDPEITPQHIFRSGIYRDPTEMRKINALPPINSASGKRPSVLPGDQTSGFGAGHQGSYKEYTRLKNKNIRDPREMRDYYRFPVTTAQEIARWRADEPLRVHEPWTHVKRHVTSNSEMTKFVKDMSLTNREFSLF